VASNSSSIGVFGWNSPTTSGTGVYGLGNTYGVYAAGNLGVSGTKSAVVALPDNRVVELYAMESPENWVEDFGSGELREGVAHVTLDPTFALTVNTGSSYHVFLTPSGECEGLYVAQKTATGFRRCLKSRLPPPHLRQWLRARSSRPGRYHRSRKPELGQLRVWRSLRSRPRQPSCRRLPSQRSSEEKIAQRQARPVTETLVVASG